MRTFILAFCLLVAGTAFVPSAQAQAPFDIQNYTSCYYKLKVTFADASCNTVGSVAVGIVPGFGITSIIGPVGSTMVNIVLTDPGTGVFGSPVFLNCVAPGGSTNSVNTCNGPGTIDLNGSGSIMRIY